MSMITPSSATQQGRPGASGKAARPTATAFETVLEGENARDRTHGFSELGMFGRASAVAYDPNAASPRLFDHPDHSHREADPVSIASKPGKSVDRTTGEAFMPCRSMKTPPPIPSGLPKTLVSSVAPNSATEIISLSPPTTDTESAPTISTRRSAATLPAPRPIRPPMALHLHEDAGTLEIVARLSHVPPEERGRVAVRLRQAAADFGYTTTKLTFNGAAPSPETPQAIGEPHGNRTR